MKPIKDETLDDMEETAVQCSKAIRAFLTYQGENTHYKDKARVAAAHLGAFARTRASESNRMAVELMAERQPAKALKA